MKQWLPALIFRDERTGVWHDLPRWTATNPPPPFGCRWCGEPGPHGLTYLRGRGTHAWEQPTEAQIKARMLARRNARKAVCRCPQDDERRPFAPVIDPYMCEAVDCHGYFSELNPFGGGRAAGHDAQVSRTCGRCGWKTSTWHVADGSAESDLHDHMVRAHGLTLAEVSR
ncbi:hypothetical protein ACIGMX_35010 [Streptomyces aquilus]|uniref:hypothetical protein n=1 Tax=Streptomyces aquilus TaxID=2548456 RepID=UPI0037D1D23F